METSAEGLHIQCDIHNNCTLCVLDNFVAVAALLKKIIMDYTWAHIEFDEFRTVNYFTISSSPFCLSSYRLLPDQTVSNFRASKSDDRHVLCCLETSIDGFYALELWDVSVV